MNRNQFMEELGRLLSGLSDNEREEALKYYNDYFDDAGPENEARVIEELKSPEQVARTIREGMADGSAEYTENGYADTRFRSGQEMPVQYQETVFSQESVRKRPRRRQENSGFWKTLCFLLLAILLLPIILPLGIGAVAIVLAILIGIVGIGFAFVISGTAVLAAGIAAIIYGIYWMFVSPAAGLCISGIGCLVMAFGILLSLAIVWACIHLIPWMIRGTVSCIRYPFRKAGIL